MIKRHYPNQPVVGVGIIILKGGKILLGKRGKEPAKDKWSIPGGAMELGETIEQAAIREAKEETRLDVYNPVLIDVINELDFDEKGLVKYQFVIVDFLVSIKEVDEPSASSDVLELKWVPLNEVENLDLTKSCRLFFIRNRQKLDKLT